MNAENSRLCITEIECFSAGVGEMRYCSTAANGDDVFSVGAVALTIFVAGLWIRPKSQAQVAEEGQRRPKEEGEAKAWTSSTSRSEPSM